MLLLAKYEYVIVFYNLFSISDLTFASAIHQVVNKALEAVLHIGAFMSLSAGYSIMKSAEAVGIMSKNGFRATVIKNSSDFIVVCHINSGMDCQIASW